MWSGYKEGMPIQICGVRNNEVTEDGLYSQEFANLTEAKKIFPDLDPENNTKRFTLLRSSKTQDGQPCGRFDTWQADELYSN